MRINSVIVLAALSKAVAFVPAQTTQRAFVTSTARTEMHATAPTMFVY